MAGDHGGDFSAMGIHATLAGRRLGKQFGFGTCVNEWGLKEGHESYLRLLGRQFNIVTAETAMKWKAIRPQRDIFDWAEADNVVSFANSNRQGVRGHCLLWHNPDALPEWLRDPATWPKDSLAAEQLLSEHINSVIDHFPIARIPVWDVVNEALDDEQGDPKNPRLRATPWSACENWIQRAFEVANEAGSTLPPPHIDPDRGDSDDSQPLVRQPSGMRGRWFINDYGCESMQGWTQNKANALYNLVTHLREEGAPITGVGLQTHAVLSWADSPSDFFEGIEENVRRYGEAGLEVQFTEAEVAGGYWENARFVAKQPEEWKDEDREKQADVYERLLQIALDAPNCTAFLLWGVTDKFSWLSQDAPLLYDRDFRPKAAAHRLANLLARSAGSGTAEFEEDGETETPEGQPRRSSTVHIEFEEVLSPA